MLCLRYPDEKCWFRLTGTVLLASAVVLRPPRVSEASAGIDSGLHLVPFSCVSSPSDSQMRTPVRSQARFCDSDDWSAIGAGVSFLKCCGLKTRRCPIPAPSSLLLYHSYSFTTPFAYHVEYFHRPTYSRGRASSAAGRCGES